MDKNMVERADIGMVKRSMTRYGRNGKTCELTRYGSRHNDNTPKQTMIKVRHRERHREHRARHNDRKQTMIKNGYDRSMKDGMMQINGTQDGNT